MTEIASSLRNGDSASFWDAAGEGKLVLQHCRQCEHIQFPPRHLCAKCWSENLADAESQGFGAIESVTVVRRAPIASFRDKVPYTVISVLLDEGPRMIADLKGAEVSTQDIGRRVRAVIDLDTQLNPLPSFRLAE